MIKIGFPAGLLYYEYFTFWKAFFKNIGLKVVSSPRTNKEILNKGISCSVDEACLPVKVYHGHVDYLKDKVDYIFIPRYYSLYKREYNCPKHLGIDRMIFNSIEDLPPLITPKIEINNPKDFKKSANEIGRILKKSQKEVNIAYLNAIEAHKLHLKWLKSRFTPIDSCKKSNIKVLVLGHSYNVYDNYVNMEILKKLSAENVNIIYPEDVDDRTSRVYSENSFKRIFWTSGRKIIGAAYNLIENGHIQGLIYLSSFGCGLDSVLMYLIEEKCVKSSIPYIGITLDEQTGEAGLNTRVEAFLDMMKWRYDNEDNISSFG